MVHPLVPFAIRGAGWYQGESNALSKDGLVYGEKMEALVGGWRKVWQQGDFPFYFVHIAPLDFLYEPTQLPKIWDAQLAALSIPNTGMAVISDVGNLRDIHPKNKREVGRRLALWALAKDYGRENLVHSGPIYKSMAVKGDRIEIEWNHVGGGLVSRDGKPLSHFEIAASDRQFKPANAQIVGDRVVVLDPDVAKPVAVRLGWNRSAVPNLANKEGLPAAPLRTDRW